MSKRKYNFTFSFPEEFNFNYIKSITKPKFRKDGWGDIEIELLDEDDNSQLNKVYQLIDIIDNKKDEDEGFPFNLIILNSYGEEVENWKIIIEEIIEVDFGYCDYYDSTNQIIKITLRPSRCHLL